jgi:Phosphodiester glycosidase
VSRARYRVWRLGALAAVLGVLAVSATYIQASHATTTTTTTTVPPETAQPGWTVASQSARGVMVDYRNISVDGAVFRVLRFRARTTLLRWHVGSSDPPLAARAPRDAGSRISASELSAGVVAAFNGGFKQAAKAGGAIVDGVTLEPLIHGNMTIAIDRFGHWEMGAWGSATFPSPGFVPIAYRQNLIPLITRGTLTAPVTEPNFMIWGDPLRHDPRQPRTGLGIDAQGNLIFVATMNPVLVVSVGRALLAAGAVTAMELDMNPFWPVLGAATTPLHAATGSMPIQLPHSEHSPSVFLTGWERDFFAVLAEPDSWSCSWASAGVRRSVHAAQPQPLTLVGTDCATSVTTSTTTSSPGSTSSSTP